MSDSPAAPAFDEAFAHRRFAGMCFNRTWDLLDKFDREGLSREEQEEMLAATFASLWHWMRRDDVTPTNLSIGFWQVSRVLCRLNEGAAAVTWAYKCVLVSDALPPFYRAYAFEALSRAYRQVEDDAASREYLAVARKHAEAIEAPDERSAIDADLATLT